MKYRKMLGNTIHRLRKAKGLSQSELGDLVGVSNKAVSKWETDEANPDVSLLPLLAEIFGVTLDEFFNDIKKINNESEEKAKSKPKKILGFEGSEINTLDEYEFVSNKRTKKGKPILHIHFGKTLSAINTKANGIIAIGNNAKGVIGIGLVSSGIFCFGLVSIGVFAFGLVSLGLLSAASIIAVGVAAFGGIAIGVVAWGGIAIGFVAIGGIAIGYYAYSGINGIAIGVKTFFY